MTTVRDVYDFLDGIAPFASQEPWDNSGLQAGDRDAQVRRAMVSLDASPEVIGQAAAFGAQLLVSHHPVLFRARKQLLADDPAWLLARHGIAAIASHTPADAMPGGVNDVLAERLGLQISGVLREVIRLCRLPAPMTAADLAALIAQKLETKARFCNSEKMISTVALCGGAGCHLLEEIYGRADAFITGDADHHAFLEARQHSLSLIAAGHYETEIHIVSVLLGLLREVFPRVEWRAAQERNAIQYT